MNFTGVLLGCGVFLIIGVLHPVVIKAEYYIGKQVWPVFAAAGIGCVVVSLFAGNVLVSVLVSVLAFSLFWSIKELFEQEERVKKGWYPANPKKLGEPEETRLPGTAKK